MTPGALLACPLRRRTASLLAGLLLLAGAAGPARGQVTGIRYTLTPLAQRVTFDKNAGLADGTFLGGRLGFGFGAYAELSGVYLASRGLTTALDRYADLGEPFEEPLARLPQRAVQARRFGADLKFNLGRGAVFPTLSLGTGILRLDPDNLDDSRTIYLSGAAGLQLHFADHYTLVVLVEDLVYRYNAARTLLSDADLADLGVGADAFRQVNVNNFAVSAGLQLYLGGRADDELTDVDRALRAQLTGGLGGIRLQVEPFGGQFDFDEALGLQEAHRMAGILAGFDLGPYLGLRGFYWRALEEDALTEPDALQAYGGEVKLGFGALTGRLAPYLVLGGGYLDVLDGYRGNGAAPPVDRPFATGGGGLTVPLGRGVQLQGSARALLLSNDAVEEVADPSQIVTSFLYTAGISFALGGGRAPGRVAAPAAAAQGGTGTLEAERLRMQADSLQQALLRARRAGAPPLSADTAALAAAGDGTRWVVVPLPERGELYVRYGEPGGTLPGQAAPQVVYVDPRTGAVVPAPSSARTPDGGAAPTGRALTAADIEAIVRQVVQEEQAAQRGEAVGAPPAGTGGSEDAVTRTDRLAARVAELERRLAAQEASPAPAPGATAEEPGGYALAGVMPLAGVLLSGSDLAFAGVRADVRSGALRGARFLPELVVGAGTEGVSFGFNADVAFPLGPRLAGLRPYAGLGVGLVRVDGQELVLNLLGGVEQAGGAGRFFVEYMSQDFFALHRVAVGYRLMR